MRTPNLEHPGAAMRRGRTRIRGLAGRRRTQLLFAVLFGAIIGGGFTAVASVGLGGEHHEGGPGMSQMGQYGPGHNDHFGDNFGDR